MRKKVTLTQLKVEYLLQRRRTVLAIRGCWKSKLQKVGDASGGVVTEDDRKHLMEMQRLLWEVEKELDAAFHNPMARATLAELKSEVGF